LRERAARLLIESKGQYPSEFDAIRSTAQTRLGSPETLARVRRAEVDGRSRPGRPTEEIAEIRELTQQGAELRRANEILKTASLFSRRSTARTGDRRLRRLVRGPARIEPICRVLRVPLPDPSEHLLRQRRAGAARQRDRHTDRAGPSAPLR
jgi:transposase